MKLHSEPHTCCPGVCKWMASYRWTLDGLHQSSTVNRCSLRLPWTPRAEAISIRNLELLGNQIDLILQETRGQSGNCAQPGGQGDAQLLSSCDALNTAVASESSGAQMSTASGHTAGPGAGKAKGKL